MDERLYFPCAQRGDIVCEHCTFSYAIECRMHSLEHSICESAEEYFSQFADVREIAVGDQVSYDNTTEVTSNEATLTFIEQLQELWTSTQNVSYTLEAYAKEVESSEIKKDPLPRPNYKQPYRLKTQQYRAPIKTTRLARSGFGRKR